MKERYRCGSELKLERDPECMWKNWPQTTEKHDFFQSEDSLAGKTC